MNRFVLTLVVFAGCATPAPRETVSVPAPVAPTVGTEPSGVLQPVYVVSGEGRVLHMLPIPLHASACRMLTCAAGRDCILRPGLPPVASCDGD